LILHGTADGTLPVELARAYVHAGRHAGDTVHYVEMPGMGHLEYLDPTSQAHAALCSWLDSTLTTQAPSKQS